jgi:hypothetical protein
MGLGTLSSRTALGAPGLMWTRLQNFRGDEAWYLVFRSHLSSHDPRCIARNNGQRESVRLREIHDDFGQSTTLSKWVGGSVSLVLLKRSPYIIEGISERVEMLCDADAVWSWTHWHSSAQAMFQLIGPWSRGSRITPH